MMEFASAELFSVTYLGLYIARKCETQQLCKQPAEQLPRRQSFAHHTITFLGISAETNGASNSKKKSHFNRCLSSKVQQIHKWRTAQVSGS